MQLKIALRLLVGAFGIRAADQVRRCAACKEQYTVSHFDQLMEQAGHATLRCPHLEDHDDQVIAWAAANEEHEASVRVDAPAWYAENRELIRAVRRGEVRYPQYDGTETLSEREEELFQARLAAADAAEYLHALENEV